MNMLRLRTPLWIAAAVFVLMVPAVVVIAGSQDGERDHRIEKVIRGFAVTGHNDVVGHPIFDWGPPFGTFSFATVGAYNPDGPDPIRLDANTPPNTLLATFIDPDLLARTGVDISEMDPAWVNVLLRDVPSLYSFEAFKKFPPIFAADASEKAQAAPNYPITLRQWMRAEGTAKISCESDELALVRLRMRNLIPNREYVVWATLGPSKRGDPEVFPSLALGGIPNVFITKVDGSATYERWMKFCPLNPGSSDRPILVINVVYMSNHQNYGAINGPQIARIPGGYWIGGVNHNHMQFPVNVALINSENP